MNLSRIWVLMVKIVFLSMSWVAFRSAMDVVYWTNKCCDGWCLKYLDSK